MTSLRFAPYTVQAKSWPSQGKHILAQYNADSVVVYQAFNAEIAAYAVEHQLFGGPAFSEDRMTWVKPNFMWMMYRCGWGLKDRNQTNILAIRLKREVFDTLLAQSWPSSFGSCAINMYDGDKERWVAAKASSGVVMQWDPDHDHMGRKLERRAIQLGIRPHLVKTLYNTTSSIISIEDITEFVSQQRGLDPDKLVTPEEHVYVPCNKELVFNLSLDSVNHGDDDRCKTNNLESSGEEDSETIQDTAA